MHKQYPIHPKSGYTLFEWFPLVLNSIVVGSQLTRVLIDGGSGLNLLFACTLKKIVLDVTSQFSSLLKEMQNNPLVPSPLSKSGIFSSQPSSSFSIKQEWDIFKATL
jgi:hypothetical protein